jgi:transposase
MSPRAKSRKKSSIAKGSVGKDGLPLIRPHAAGIDIGSMEHWVCCPPKADGSAHVKTFGTTTIELMALAKWLKAEGIKSVAMESTSVYWIPLFEILESQGFEVLLANARQLSNVPGRKTDMLDCQWIQLLHACGLLRGSFRPSGSVCQMRALLRECGNLVEERTRKVQRMQKALDQMNIQVHRALTDITGITGMAILRAIVAGERDPKVLADLRDRRCKKSLAEFVEYLRGTWRGEHLFNLEKNLELYDQLTVVIDEYHTKIREFMVALQCDDRRDQVVPEHPNRKKGRAIIRQGEEQSRQDLWRFSGVDLTRIDAISTGSAMTIYTEVGMDLSAFPSEKHFASWLRLTPNRNISGGKVLKKRRNAMGATRVANVLRMCACSLDRSHTALGAQYRRIARRKGKSVAVFAMARRLAILVYRMLRFGQDYVDKGEEAYEEQYKDRKVKSMISTAKQLGYELIPIRTADVVSG